MTDTVKLLSDDEVAELQARPSTELGGYRRVLLRPRERDALCATVRALDTERNQWDKSLLSSEVARAIALHIKGKNSDYFYTSEGLAELEAIVSRHFVVAAQSDAAARMRDRCVEKVKRKADGYQKDSERSDYLPNYRRNMALAASALREVANDLQSLTLEGEQEKQR